MAEVLGGSTPEQNLTNELFYFLIFTTNTKNESPHRFWQVVKCWNERHGGCTASFETKKYIYAKFRQYVQNEYKIGVSDRLFLTLPLEECVCHFLNQYRFKSTNGLRLKVGLHESQEVTQAPEVIPTENQPAVSAASTDLRHVFTKNVENANLRFADLEMQVVQQRNEIAVLQECTGKIETIVNVEISHLRDNVKQLESEVAKIKNDLQKSRTDMDKCLGFFNVWNEDLKKLKRFKVHQEVHNRFPNNFSYPPGTPQQNLPPETPLSMASSCSHEEEEEQERKNILGLQ